MELAEKLNGFIKPKTNHMKYRLLVLFLVLMQACGDNNKDKDNTEMMDPNDVHPIEESLTDSTKLVNDSVIVPDTVGDSL